MSSKKLEKKSNQKCQKKFNKDWNDLHSIRVQVWESYEYTKTINDKRPELQDNSMPDLQGMVKAQRRRKAWFRFMW